MGGGTALAEIPEYIENIHHAMLDGGGPESHNFPNGILDYMLDAINEGSPWDDEEAYDPNDKLGDIDDAYTSYKGLVDSLNPVDDWATYYDLVKAKAEEVGTDESTIDDDVASYEERTLPNYSRALSQTLGALYQSNASEGSVIIVALALARRGRFAEIETYRNSLQRDESNKRSNFILNALNQVVQLQNNKLAENRIAMAIKQELAVLNINANREYIGDKLEFAYKGRTYELGLFAPGGNLIAAASGAPTIPLGPSKLATMLSTGLSVASAGVQLFGGLK